MNPPSPSRTDQLRSPHHLTYVLKAGLILDGVANLATDEECDPPTVRAQVNKLPPGRSTINYKRVFRIKALRAIQNKPSPFPTCLSTV